MARRRGRGEGTITQRTDGRWQARVDMGRGEDGQRQRKTVYGATRADVGSKLNALLGRASSGELLTTSTPTLASWLKDWHKTHQGEWRPATRRTYQIAIDKWLAALGTVRLEQLKPAKIQKWINQATAEGARESIVLAHVVLRSALKWAMTQRVLTFNAAALCKVPRPIHARVPPLSVEQARRLLEHAGRHRLGGMVLVSLSLGLRIGEACGLSWADVDLPAKTMSVRQQVQVGAGMLTLAPLKTAHSRRTLTLPGIMVDALKARRVAQLEERLKAGAEWDGDGDLIFTTERGRMLQPVTVRRVLAVLLEQAGLDAIKFHTLRHTAATLLLADGTPLFDVSRILGHAQVSTTADVYGHLVPDMTAGAAARMDTLLKAKA